MRARVARVARVAKCGMRVIGFLFGLLVWSCVPHAEMPVERSMLLRDVEPVAAARPVSGEQEEVPVFSGVVQLLRFADSRHGEVRMSGVAFDAREYRLRVVDQENGPGSRFADAAAVGRAFGAVAVANAGFFTPEGRPLGLVVCDGRKAGAWNSASSLGSAMWWEDGEGRMAIVRRSAASRAQASSARYLVQSGPLLVESGRPVGGLEESKTSARTFLMWDGGQRWWMGVSSPVSLARLARLLSEEPPVDWKPQVVLNLDGGRSSDLWVSAAVAGKDVSMRMPWNRPVRNFLVLEPR